MSVTREDVETALRAMELWQLVDLVGSAPLDPTIWNQAAWCVKCQRPQDPSRLHSGPSLQLVVPNGSREEATTWACRTCGSTGTRKTFVRSLLASPTFMDELLYRAREAERAGVGAA